MYIFHVHTYRCHHAENIPDESYIKKAVALGVSDIWFTDHAPFPGDPFSSRMAYAELEEYFRTLRKLKQQYSSLKIHIGLEIEYFPHFDKMGYYRYLRSLPDLEMLLLGQHMAEISDSPPSYSFSESKEFLTENEYRLLGAAIIQGAKTGYFNAIAHPDRIFRRCPVWTSVMEDTAAAIIQTAAAMHLPLEMNLSSVEKPANYKQQFWELVPDGAEKIAGLDAHSLHEMESRYMEIPERLKKFRK